MDKLIVGILVVCFTTFFGRFLSKKYRQRKAFFLQWSLFNERFLGEVSYYRRPIKEFYEKYVYQGEFNDFLQSFLENLSNAEGKDVYEGLSFLEKDDIATVKDYFQMLGKGDSGTQKAYFTSVKSTLSTRLSVAETDAKKYGDLYLKLGFLCGLALLIVIV
ncbi:MAG: stage III sporulation protein AB [Clostridia bacterium]|nr:stage III sporulation protein AB [Clostridia bacterium]